MLTEMKKIIIMIVLVFPLRLTSQSLDHLEPEEGLFMHPHLKYMGIVEKLLTKSDPIKGYVAYMLCIPSFSPEWIVYLEQSGSRNWGSIDHDTTKDFICSEKAINHIWHVFDKPDSLNEIKTKLASKHIPHFIQQEIRNAFVAVLTNTKYSPKEYLVLDGTDYHFMVVHTDNMPQMYGYTDSPDENKSPGKLVQLGKAMFKYSQVNEIVQADSLLNEMYRLTKDLLK